MKWLRAFWRSSAAEAPLGAPDIQRRRIPRATVQVGIDFGTSTTKVLYRVLGQRTQAIRAPLLASGHNASPAFFVPSLLAIGADGSLWAGSQADAHLRDKPWDSGLSRFKMLVAGCANPAFLDDVAWNRYRAHVVAALGDDQALSPEIAASVFLAHVMRETRQRLQVEVEADELDLLFNICVPIDQAEHADVHRAFQRVIACAQWLYDTRTKSERPSLQWVDSANEHFASLKYDAADDRTRVFLIPEAVASFATYQSSLSHREGIHALIDIGAGTTDVSIAYLAVPRHDVPRAQWWSARSVPHGMGRIEDEIARTITGHSSDRVCTRKDLFAALEVNGEAPAWMPSIVAEQMQRLWELTESAWREGYGHYPGQSRWSKGKVNVFLAGGGAQLSLAKAVFSQSWMKKWGPYPTSTLPAPDGKLEYAGVPFSRLSVAFGLCKTLPELGDIVLPSAAHFHGRSESITRPSDGFDGPT